MIPEEEVERDIGQADEITEQKMLAINSIDHALEQAGQRVVPASVVNPSLEKPSRVPGGSTPPHPTDSSRRPSGSSTPPPIDTAEIPTTHQPKVKLPKLIIKKFKGDLTKWTTFWDSFESSIHTNTTP